MNWSELASDWERSTSLLRSYWPRLTTDLCTVIGGNRARLNLALRLCYDMNPDDAEAEICCFEKNVRWPGTG